MLSPILPPHTITSIAVSLLAGHLLSEQTPVRVHYGTVVTKLFAPLTMP